LINGNRKSEIK